MSLDDVKEFEFCFVDDGKPVRVTFMGRTMREAERTFGWKYPQVADYLCVEVDEERENHETP